MQLSVILAYISMISTVIPLVVALFLFKKLSIEMKLFLGYFAITIVVDSISLYLIMTKGSVFWMHHYFTLFEYFTFASLFLYWHKRRWGKLVSALSMPIFTIFWIVSKIYFEQPDDFDYLTSTTESVFLIAISIFYFLESAEYAYPRISKRYSFWVTSGVLIYFSSNFLTFIFANVAEFWFFHHVINFFTNMLFVYAFYLCAVSAADK
ncbi:MAG: hypothetical protein GF315_12245 [candidate division Zixibacteria bacterium]|nr:hypothetical protein [candidate division Zixibacteria bacterium]